MAENTEFNGLVAEVKRLADILEQRDAVYNERFTKIKSSMDTITQKMDLLSRTLDRLSQHVDQPGEQASLMTEILVVTTGVGSLSSLGLNLNPLKPTVAHVSIGSGLPQQASYTPSFVASAIVYPFTTLQRHWDTDKKPSNDRPQGLHSLTYQELMNHKSEGLCYRCGEHFHLLHQCPHSLRVMIWGEDENLLAIEVEELDGAKSLECGSLSAAICGGLSGRVTGYQSFKMEPSPTLLMGFAGFSPQALSHEFNPKLATTHANSSMSSQTASNATRQLENGRRSIPKKLGGVKYLLCQAQWIFHICLGLYSELMERTKNIAIWLFLFLERTKHKLLERVGIG